MQLKSGIPKSYLDTNGTLAANSDTKVASQKAVKTYVGAATVTAAATATILNDVSTNATMYLTWVTGTSGNLPLKVSETRLSFNSSTGLLTNTGSLKVTTTEVAGIIVESNGTTDVMAANYTAASNNPGGHRSRRARGTIALPTAVLDDDIIGRYYCDAYDGTAFANGGFVEFRTVEDWTVTAHGTEINFENIMPGTIAVHTLAQIATNATQGFYASAASPTAWRLSQVETVNSVFNYGNFGIGTEASHKLHIVDTNTTSQRAGLYVSQTGAVTGTGYGGYFSKTGASTTNVAGFFAASGGTSNYGIQVANGASLIGSYAWPTSIIGLGAGRVCIANTGGNGQAILHDDTAVAADTGPGPLHFTGRTNDTGPAYSILAQIMGKKANATQGNTAAYLKFLVNNGTSSTEFMRGDSALNIIMGGITAGGTSLAKGIACGIGTAASAVVVGAQLWAANINGASTGGWQFMNQAAATAYTVMGCSGTTAVSTGIATTLMGSANVGTNAGWLTTLNNLGVAVYVPYWTTATP